MVAGVEALHRGLFRVHDTSFGHSKNVRTSFWHGCCLASGNDQGIQGGLMAERRISRRGFLSGVAAAGVLPGLWARDASAQGPAPPPNVRLAPKAPPAGGAGNRQLLGGWRVAQEFARGAIAIDFATNRLWMVGHPQKQQILEFQLPAMGNGGDVDTWPRVDPVRTIEMFWPGYAGGQQTYANGLCFWRGKLWVAPRVFYAGGGTESAVGNLTLYAPDGDTFATSLPRQKFSGFVKRGPGLDPLIGGGGAESGQGSTRGPSLGTLGGQVLISYGFPELPGANLENWNMRAPREPNYRPLRTGTGGTANPIPEDSWVGWIPRMVNGNLEGRWATDRVFGGGLVLPEGITYWPWMGTGDMDYAWQVWTFAPEYLNRTYVYRYDASSYQLLGYEAAPQFDTNLAPNGITAVLGQELGPDGKVYLAHGYQWRSGAYVTDVALKVFG